MARGLRSFLAALEDQKDLARIRKEVDPRFEVAALMKRGADQDGPALYFERVRGSGIPPVANVLAPGAGSHPHPRIRAHPAGRLPCPSLVTILPGGDLQGRG